MKSGKQRAGKAITDSYIRRRTISVTIQHPATLLPAAVGFLGIVYLIILAPIFGGVLAAGIVVGVTVITAGATYFTRYEKDNIRIEHQLRAFEAELLNQKHKEQLQERIDTLDEGFTSIPCPEGNQTLEGLVGAYKELQTTLGQKRASDPLSISSVDVLAETLFEKGLGILETCLGIIQGVHAFNRNKLESNIRELEQSLQALRLDPGQAEREKLNVEKLDSNKRDLDKLNNQELQFDKQLFLAQNCEDGLLNIKISLVKIRAADEKSSIEAIINTIQERIKQMEEVQEELKKMGY